MAKIDSKVAANSARSVSAKTEAAHSFQKLLINIIRLSLTLLLIIVGIVWINQFFGIKISLGPKPTVVFVPYVPKVDRVLQKSLTHSNEKFAQWSNNEFRWNVAPPNLRVAREYEIHPAYEKWCAWMSTASITWHNFDGQSDGGSPSKQLCLAGVTLELMGSPVPASQLIALKVSESGTEDNPNTATSYAGAKGQFQFIDETWKKYAPYPTANRNVLLDAMLAAATMNHELQISILDDFATFKQQFSCEPVYPKCRVWNFHSGQAAEVYELAWILQKKLNEFAKETTNP